MTCAVPWRRRMGKNAPMQVSAKADYAVRAAIELAAAGPGPGQGRPDRRGPADPAQVPREHPLRPAPRRLRAEPAGAPRAATGWPSRPTPSPWPTSSGPWTAPLANVRGARPESVAYSGSASRLVEVWIAGPGRPAQRARAGDPSRPGRRGPAGTGEGADHRRRRLGVARARGPHPAPDTPAPRSGGPTAADPWSVGRPARNRDVTGSRRIGHHGETTRIPPW
jgi:hypothetical protein